MGFRRQSNNNSGSSAIVIRKPYSSSASSASNSTDDILHLDGRAVNDSLKAAQVTFERHKARQGQSQGQSQQTRVRRRASPPQLSKVSQHINPDFIQYKRSQTSASDTDTDIAHIAAMLAHHNCLSDQDLSRGDVAITGNNNGIRGPSPIAVGPLSQNQQVYYSRNNSTGSMQRISSPTAIQRAPRTKVRPLPALTTFTPGNPEVQTPERSYLDTDTDTGYRANDETTLSSEDTTNHYLHSSSSTIVPQHNPYYNGTGSYTYTVPSTTTTTTAATLLTTTDFNGNVFYDLDAPISSLIQPRKHKPSKVKRLKKMFTKGSSVPIATQQIQRQRQSMIQQQQQQQQQQRVPYPELVSTPTPILTPSSTSTTFQNSRRTQSTPASPILNLRAARSPQITQTEPTISETPLRFKTTMRFEKRKKSFNEDKPWKQHRGADFLSERERKRYEAVWVSNRFAYLNLLDWWPSMDTVNDSGTDSVGTNANANDQVKVPSEMVSCLPSAGLGIEVGNGNTKRQFQKRSLAETAAATVFGYEEEQLLLQQQQQQQQQQSYHQMSQSQEDDKKQYTRISEIDKLEGEEDDGGDDNVVIDNYDVFEDDDLDEEDEVDDIMDHQGLAISSEDEPTDSTSGSKNGSASTSASTSGSGSDMSSDRENFLLDLPKDGLILNVVVKDIWERSNLPNDLLRQIYDLVDLRKDGTLDRKSFIVGMWLVDQCLYGRKLPTSINQMIWDSVDKFALNVYQRRKERTLQEKKVRRRKRDIVGRELKHIKSGIKHVHL